MRKGQLSALAEMFEPANDPRYDVRSPLDLAITLDPTLKATPALRKIDEALVKVEAGEIKRLIITMPPQNGKSTLATRYNALWVLRRNPDARVAVVSYGDSIAESFSRLIRSDIDTFNGEDGNADLGLRLRKDSRSVRAWDLALPNKGGLFAVGVGGSLTGRPVGYLIIDDPVKDAKDADSDLLSGQAWDWWQAVARTRLAPNAPVVVILTRWHQNDLAGRLIAQEREDEEAGLVDYDSWTVVNIPAQAESDDDILGREPGEFMLSARGLDDAGWRRTKAGMSARLWNALYQGRPSPESGDIFQTSWWRYYGERLWWSEKGVHRVSGKYALTQSWDLAFAGKATSDFVVGQVWAQHGADAYLVDQVRERLTFTETLAAMKAMVAKWPQSHLKLVENKANGAAVIDSLRHDIPGIVPVTPKESKISRARGVAPFIESGNVYLPTADIALFKVDDLIDEAVNFPNGAHDDQIDAMSQALARILLHGSRLEQSLADIVPPCPNCGVGNYIKEWGHGRCRECHEPLPAHESKEYAPGNPRRSEEEGAEQAPDLNQLPPWMQYDPRARATMQMLDAMQPWFLRGNPAMKFR